jgi:hypothetical protein
VPEGPGLGIELNEEVVTAHLERGQYIPDLPTNGTGVPLTTDFGAINFLKV